VLRAEVDIIVFDLWPYLSRAPGLIQVRQDWRRRDASDRGVKPAWVIVAPPRVRHTAVVVIGIHVDSQPKLPVVADALGPYSPLLRLRQRRQKHRRKNRDNRNHHEQLDQRKPMGIQPHLIMTWHFEGSHVLETKIHPIQRTT